MILVVSYPDEEHTTAVTRLLDQAGHEVVLLDLGDLPARAALTLDYEGPGMRPAYVVEGPAGRLSLGSARVGWWRRVRPFSTDPSLRVQDSAFAQSETTQAVHGMLSSLPCAWVNPPALDERAHHKPYQWATALEVGLRLPRTCVTNSPERARDFVDAVGLGRVVFKAFLATLEAWRETRLLTRSDLALVEAVRFAPVIFQEYVPGVDLRVTVVGDEVYAAEIDASGTSYPVDMRMVVGEAKTRAVELPGAVCAALLELMRRLGLVYGAIDLRRNAAGEHVFLEVNPAGQWLFAEQHTGLPITAAVANLLGRLDRRAGSDGRRIGGGVLTPGATA